MNPSKHPTSDILAGIGTVTISVWAAATLGVHPAVIALSATPILIVIAAVSIADRRRALSQPTREQAATSEVDDNVHELTENDPAFMSRSQVREAERSAVINALNALEALASDVGYPTALNHTRTAYRAVATNPEPETGQ